ncbi:hypothetical protein GCM10010129_71540 [Streptomyces fumigatiscleroticus]|nr:hypothetical protein GCM10010129_71540 [Streptomyces fumigatiscleroticus]
MSASSSLPDPTSLPDCVTSTVVDLGDDPADTSEADPQRTAVLEAVGPVRKEGTALMHLPSCREDRDRGKGRGHGIQEPHLRLAGGQAPPGNGGRSVLPPAPRLREGRRHDAELVVASLRMAMATRATTSAA